MIAEVPIPDYAYSCRNRVWEKTLLTKSMMPVFFYCSYYPCLLSVNCLK